ncbi:MAG: CotH kinase family protein, partial [Bacteroidia bacterium]|nr:CotH kinase family protein [Bacteroidia bacterium]
MKKTILFSLIFSSSFFNKKSFSQNEGDNIFSAAQIHDVYMTFTQPNYWDSLTNYYTIDKYLRGNIVFNGTAYNNVGIKFKGNSSYSNPSEKKSFKVDMNEFVSGQNVDGLKKFNLNNGFKDPTFLREKLMLDFCKEHGLAAPRCSYSRVYINGVYWGLYTFIEEVDNGNFLKAHYNNKQGNMFKGDPSGDLKWYGSSHSSYYTKYELKTNETINDWTDLVSFINKINNSGTYFYDSIETILNTSVFIKHWALSNLFVNIDSYIGSGHNYFIYHDTLTKKFEWVTWDVNEAFGNFQMGMTVAQLKNLS